MTSPLVTGTILDRIISHKVEEIAAAKLAHPLATVRSRAEALPKPRDFVTALRAPGVSLIAEVKRASPSVGPLRLTVDPPTLATAYADAGAAAISVLTDREFFQGSLTDLGTVRQYVTLPLLRKDFAVDPYQIYEARAAGADAALLIAAILETALCRDLLALTWELNMEALVEVHNRDELDRVLVLAPHVIGINNRDLHTFHVTLDTTASLRRQVPAGTVVVAESGIQRPQDIDRLAQLDVDAALIGTALVTAPDPAARIRWLMGWDRGVEELGEARRTADRQEMSRSAAAAPAPQPSTETTPPRPPKGSEL